MIDVMTDVTFEVWSNPRCSTCQKTLALLSEHGIHPQVVHYLKDAPSEGRIKSALGALGISARELVRKKESLYSELKLESADDDALVSAMARNPILIQRPVVLMGARGVVARPPEMVLSLIKPRTAIH